jgi:tetratricopeptide (TPR) repeat protein
VAALLAVLIVQGTGAAGGQNWKARIVPPEFVRQGPRQLELTDARKQLAPLLLTDPQDATLRFTAARLARRAGDYEAARKDLAEYRRLAGNTPAGQLEELLLRAQDGEQDDLARDLHARADKDRTAAPLIHEALARGYFEEQRLAEGLRELAAWLEREPNSARALLWRGWALHGLGKQAAAMQSFRQAARLAPAWDAPQLELAEVLLENARAAEAVALYERLRGRWPQDVDVRVGLARCWVLLGKLAEADKMLDEVLKEHPRQTAALAHRGSLALQEGRPAEAERRLRQALKEEPASYRVIYQLVMCLRQQDKPAEANALMGRLRAIGDDKVRLEEILNEKLPEAQRDPDLRCEVGRILLRNGQDKQGLRWLHSALRIDPQHRAARQALAEHDEAAKKGTNAGK